jgi:hypothetical protein
MKKLQTTFDKGGFKFELVKRDGMAAVYRKKKQHHSRWSFEAVLIQSHEGYKIGGAEIPSGEAMPSNEQWGRLGFTYQEEAAAIAKMEMLKDLSSRNQSQS